MGVLEGSWGILWGFLGGLGLGFNVPDGRTDTQTFEPAQMVVIISRFIFQRLILVDLYFYTY